MGRLILRRVVVLLLLRGELELSQVGELWEVVPELLPSQLEESSRQLALRLDLAVAAEQVWLLLSSVA